MRIFLDANILFSAAYSDAALRRLIKDFEAVSCSLVADRYVFEEALRNLTIQRSEAVPRLHELVSLLTIDGLSIRSPVDTAKHILGCH